MDLQVIGLCAESDEVAILCYIHSYYVRPPGEENPYFLGDVNVAHGTRTLEVHLTAGAGCKFRLQGVLTRSEVILEELEAVIA
jgi:hypothetical protein